MSDPPQPPGTSASTSTSISALTNVKHQNSLFPRSNNGIINSNFSPNNGKNDTQGDTSSSDELEEGEISERDLPPLPPLRKPIPLIPASSRRYRKPPYGKPPPARPPLRDLPYSFPPDLEQSLSQREYRDSPVEPPFPPLYPHLPFR